MDEKKVDNIDATNEIIEINNNEEKTAIYDLKEIKKKEQEKQEEKKSNKSNSKKSQKASKTKPNKKSFDKKKIIIIVVIVIALIAIIISLFLVFKNKNKNHKSNKPSVVVQEDNYRYEDGTLILLNSDDKEIGKYECNVKDKDLCYIAKYSNEDDYDETKYVYENGIEVKFPSKIYSDSYVLIYDNAGKEKGLISLYDIDNSKVIGKYKLAKEVEYNKVILKDENNKYGLKDLTDNSNIIDFEYDYLGFIKNKDLIIGIKDLNNYLIDMEGKVVTEKITGNIKNYNSKYISVLIDNEYTLLDYDGNDVLHDKFDYIKLDSEIISVIKNRKLYLFDNYLNKLNIEGIVLGKLVYEDKVVLDKNLNEINRTEGYSINANADTVVINKDREDEVLINRYDGILSSKLKNIDYFGDILYIYEDAEKTNLVGKYKCDNKNNIDSGSTSLNNCYIAKEKALLNRSKDSKNLGFLPIYNKRYVFIQDGINIKLWDLKKEQKLATYKEVDAGFYDNKNDINFVDTANTLVLAKNTSDSLGMVRIEASDVKGIISFKNNNVSIKLLNDYILAKRKDGTYHLYDMNGEEINKNITIKNEIVGFNGLYYKVKYDNYYMLYTKDGKIVNTGNNLIYIKMYDDFFVGISDKDEIGIYEYDGTKHINPEGNSTILFKDDLDKSYKITIDGKKITVDVMALDNEISYSFMVSL